MEEAAAYQQLIEDFNLSHDDVARRVGKSRSAVSNMLRLFQLPPSIQKLVADRQLSAGHARALLGTPDRAFQEALARRAVAEQLSVREVEEAVRARSGRPRTAMPRAGDGAKPSVRPRAAAAAAGPARARGPPVGSARHPREGRDGSEAGQGDRSSSPASRTSSASTGR